MLINDRFDVIVVHADVVGLRGRAVGGQHHGGRGGATGRTDAERRAEELIRDHAVEHLPRVVAQGLIDHVLDVVLAQALDLLGEGHRVAEFLNGERTLCDRELRLGHPLVFADGTATGTHRAIDVPPVRFTLMEAERVVLGVGKIAELRARLKLHAQILRQIVGIEKASARVGGPDLTSHGFWSFRMGGVRPSPSVAHAFGALPRGGLPQWFALSGRGLEGGGPAWLRAHHALALRRSCMTLLGVWGCSRRGSGRSNVLRTCSAEPSSTSAWVGR